MVAKATKSTKDVKPKAEDVLDQSTDVLADALGTARDETADIAPEDELKAEKPEVKTVESNSEPLEEESVIEPNNPDPLVEQTTVSAPEAKRGFMPVFLGGLVAAVLGFGVARTEIFDAMLPDSWQLARGADVHALSSRMDSQTQDVANLSGEVASIAVPDMTPLESGIAGNSASIEAIQAMLGSLSTDIMAVDSRLTTLEKQPISQGVSQAAIDAYERELQDIQSAVATQRSEIESLLSDAQAMEQNAELTAQDALARAALTRVLSAIDSGAPFDAALDDLVSVTGTTPPGGLIAVAQRGVTPLIQLQNRFPEAARAALLAARQDDPDAENGVVAFFSRQLGARSVAPREGSDPDAVLSRAEASLKEGRLNDALAEIETLPPAATSALSDWVAMAEARRAAQDAAETLAQSLNSN